MPNKTIPFKFSLLPGDLINALAGVRAICLRMNRTAEIYLALDIEWAMTDEISKGRLNKITLTKKSLDMLSPLLLKQPWISKVASLEAEYPDKYNAWCEAFKKSADFEYAGRWYQENQDAFIDLDKHHLMPIKLQFSNIFRWNFYVYPDMTCDLSEPWLEVPHITIPSKKILINRTKRSQNPTISYKFLKKYEDRIVFVGYRDEYVDFCTMFDLNIEYYKIDNFLDLAQAIKMSAFFIGNQSLAFSLAEAMKVPRVLEVCSYLPNVIPCGKNAYDFYFQSSFEIIVGMLAEPLAGYKGDQYSQIE